jgi:hypothetical protein
MINKIVMKSLLNWDEPQMFKDINFYMEVNALLVFLMHEDINLKDLSSEQISLLEHLITGALQATINAFEKVENEQQGEVVEILEALSAFADELQEFILSNSVDCI